MKHLVTILIGLALVGCATSGKINAVNIGMTKDEVIKVMGKPCVPMKSETLTLEKLS